MMYIVPCLLLVLLNAQFAGAAANVGISNGEVSVGAPSKCYRVTNDDCEWSKSRSKCVIKDWGYDPVCCTHNKPSRWRPHEWSCDAKYSDADFDVDCYGSWSNYGQCSKTCGGGVKTRTYSISQKKEYGGTSCSWRDGSQDTASCNNQQCPKDCVGAWSWYSSCSSSCGSGSRTKTYSITTEARYGGSQCPYSDGDSQTQGCDSGACPDTSPRDTSPKDTSPRDTSPRAASPRAGAKREDCTWRAASEDECAPLADDLSDKLPPCNYGQKPNTFCEADEEHDINIELGYNANEVDNCKNTDSEQTFDVFFYECTKDNFASRQDNAKEIKNHEKPLQGYDIKRGNPMPIEETSDMGWKAQIFEAEYNAKNKLDQVNGDGTYRVPDGVDVFDCSSSCSMTATLREVYGTKSYQRSLAIAADVSGAFPAAASSAPASSASASSASESSASASSASASSAASPGLGGAFTLSTGYNSVKEKSSQKHTVETLATAKCCVYDFHINRDTPPNFTKHFHEAVKNLPDNYDREAYADFVQTFGTSWSMQTLMGARVIQQIVYEQDQWAESKAKKFSLAATASMTFPGGSVSTGGSIDREKKEGQDQFQRSLETKIQFMGKSFDANSDVNEWMQGIIEHPVPIHIILLPISDLLNSKKYGDKYDPSVAAKLEFKQKNLIEYYKEYCSDGTCDEVLPDESPYDIKATEKRWAAQRSQPNPNSSRSTTREVLGAKLCPNYEEGNHVVAINGYERSNRGISDIQLVCKKGEKLRFTERGENKEKVKNYPREHGLTGIKVYHQRSHYKGIGVVNFQVKSKTDNTYYDAVRSDKKSSKGAIRKTGLSECDTNEVMVGANVLTKSGQGIIDIQVFCLNTGRECNDRNCKCNGDFRVVNKETGDVGRWYMADSDFKCDAKILGLEYIPDFEDNDHATCFCRDVDSITESLKRSPQELKHRFTAAEAESSLGFISSDSSLIKGFAVLGGTSILYWLGQYMLKNPAYRKIEEQNEV